MTIFNQSISRRTMLQGTASIAGAGLVGLALKQTVFARNHDATPAASAYPKSTYVAKEYAFDGPVALTAGYNEITLQNDGTMDHHGMLLKLHDGKTTADLAAATSLEGLFAVSKSVGGPGGTGAKQSATVILNLEAGGLRAGLRRSRRRRRAPHGQGDGAADHRGRRDGRRRFGSRRGRGL